MSGTGIQYISNESGAITGVLVPITMWEEILSELESAMMKQRLLEARNRTDGISLDTALQQLGLSAS